LANGQRDGFGDVGYDGSRFLVAFDRRSDVTGWFATSADVSVGESYPISEALGTQSRPTIAFFAGAYTTVFVDNRNALDALYMQRVGTDGSAPSTPTITNEPLIAGTSPVSEPQMAALGDQALVVYEAGGDIFSTLITP
jgi:hypothetical protein